MASMGVSAASALLAAILAIAATAAIGQPAPPPTATTTAAELESARALWAAQGSADYVMRFQRGAMFFEPFFEPVRVTVKGGAVAEVVLDGSGAAPQGSNAERISTVVEVFDIIESSLNDPVAVVTATYDSVHGAPTEVVISADPSSNIQDFGSSYNIEILEFLPQTPTGGPSAQAEELANARALWAAQGSTDYVMRFQRSALFFEPFFEPVIVTVEGAVVTEVVLEGSGAAPQGSNADGILTVVEVFDVIESSLKDPVAVVTVVYDPATGAPNDVDISADPSSNIQDFGSNYSTEILELLTPTNWTTGGDDDGEEGGDDK
ncbi:unnamed protein product [Ostreobium quekettii]|uniref:GerMN domain-containing protein n=1 Tax=Ostreobium quekettii TaxID=121088 RepID=A0A8S1IRK8_9CHLO|nr:unnamed protein product [Ostreobium quekettii]|eukprot:evm.model.scf_19.7 EVM.evm.TU.scf_19.7   scf_19:173319-174692(+)